MITLDRKNIPVLTAEEASVEYGLPVEIIRQARERSAKHEVMQKFMEDITEAGRIRFRRICDRKDRSNGSQD